ncbi:MAG: hypothetical protein G01um101448_329 [Parcubacteria group bacterium Gr01-1014_48]|nr:MAG: hypothetical protein Greene041614_901 [Parcubacteria group bacterium Greene0416_14]TSC74125.1 MAG: hypothetical protein G01um101448_329 [Parcubacteria group bacterium Gr01-1014_48]TSD00169.1 MAG: hypothetical protein Greene101415_945 [Parcubacteria group bacterium Greene1014_15]TSD07514.1 MAG: hypothetical protein Greene07144_883 [Parcubacteria group bacterium Greene0714_4]
MLEFPEELMTTMIVAPVTILILVWLIFLRATERRFLAFGIGFALSAWLAAALLFSRGGFFLALSLYPIPNIGLLFVPIIVGITFLAKSTAFQKLVDNIYQPWIIGVQVTRVMGIVFLTLHAQGLMPAEFAIPSGIGDVIIGATAPVVAAILFFNFSFGKKLAIVWNIVGFADLIVAIILGFLTSPTPYQAVALDNPNYLLFDFPLALVPVFAVPLSLLLHLFSLRVLLKKPSQTVL